MSKNYITHQKGSYEYQTPINPMALLTVLRWRGPDPSLGHRRCSRGCHPAGGDREQRQQTRRRLGAPCGQVQEEPLAFDCHVLGRGRRGGGGWGDWVPRRIYDGGRVAWPRQLPLQELVCSPLAVGRWFCGKGEAQTPWQGHQVQDRA
jgi:hypothetical protein